VISFLQQVMIGGMEAETLSGPMSQLNNATQAEIIN